MVLLGKAFNKMHTYKLTLITLALVLFVSCIKKDKNTSNTTTSDKTVITNPTKPRELSEDFKNYWYSGLAEITSYRLQQERYGQIHEGTAVNIFVSEDLLPDTQVKANNVSEENISVLKLNSTKKFNTGIYPYSIMTSTFSPIISKGHALKVSNSVQEWCGQAYTQLNTREEFEVESHSYFEGEADQAFVLPKTWLEDELWNLIRINPEELPTGDVMIIPSFEYSRLKHKKLEEQKAFASLKQGDSITIYTLNYPEIQRQLMLFFNSEFPYEIEKWEETNAADQNDTLRLKTTAVKLKRLLTPYWRQHKNEDSFLRDSLDLTY